MNNDETLTAVISDISLLVFDGVPRSYNVNRTKQTNFTQFTKWSGINFDNISETCFLHQLQTAEETPGPK